MTLNMCLTLDHNAQLAQLARVAISCLAMMAHAAQASRSSIQLRDLALQVTLAQPRHARYALKVFIVLTKSPKLHAQQELIQA